MSAASVVTDSQLLQPSTDTGAQAVIKSSGNVTMTSARSSGKSLLPVLFISSIFGNRQVIDPAN